MIMSSELTCQDHLEAIIKWTEKGKGEKKRVCFSRCVFLDVKLMKNLSVYCCRVGKWWSEGWGLLDCVCVCV